jgi:glycosyltransferase involved in cell wall biosynthesis
MHVLGKARTDIRAMRAATTLVAAGYEVCIQDVEGADVQFAEEDIDGIHVQHLVASDSFMVTRFDRWALMRAARMLIRNTLRLIRTPADIYHALDLPALPACYIAARLHRKPLIFEAYELPLSTRPLSELSTSRRWLHALITPLLSLVVPYCASVITVSPPIVEEIRRRYHTPRVSLIRNIPAYQVVERSDRLRQHLGLSAEIRIALYQGYIQSDRALDILVRAAAFLQENTVIVMMGANEGSMQAQLEALIASERVADRVKIIPPVAHTELLDWTASADLGLIIYRPDFSPNVQMMLPNKLFEYLLAGLPVLASSLDAISDIVRTHEVGQIVSSLSPEDVGAAINAMLSDQVTLARMRRNALEAARHEFHWEKESQKLVRLYHEIR